MQNIVEGNVLINLFSILSTIKLRNIFIVAGKSFDRQQLSNKILDVCGKYVRFREFSTNPKYEDIVAGTKLFNREGCDGILAIGGGSTIDVAKCIKLFCGLDDSLLYIGQKYFDNGIPLIAVPTTAGSGSESTSFAVCYYEGEKKSIEHSAVLPNYVILDPNFLLSLPMFQRKCTVADALCQSIEAWWSVNSNKISIKYSQEALYLLINNMQLYVDGKDSEKVLTNIMRASNFAGQAINIAKTTAAHAMSYRLTTLYGFPHGYSVALCLPYIWEYMLIHLNDIVDERGKDYIISQFVCIAKILLSYEKRREFSKITDINICYSAVECLKKIFYSWEFVPPADVVDSEIDFLSGLISEERLKNNPVNLKTDEIKLIYRKALKR